MRRVQRPNNPSCIREYHTHEYVNRIGGQPSVRYSMCYVDTWNRFSEYAETVDCPDTDAENGNDLCKLQHGVSK